MNELRINLQNLISTGSKILSGRDKGELLRAKIELDKKENEYEKIKIVIPISIVSFNSSYFLGLFTPSVKKYKTREAFLEKYEFECDDFIWKDIEDGIKEALKKSNLL